MASNRRRRVIQLEPVSGITGAPAGYPPVPDDAIPLEQAPQAVQEQAGAFDNGDFLWSPSGGGIYISPKLWAIQHGQQWPLPSEATTNQASTSTQTGSASPNSPGDGGSGSSAISDGNQTSGGTTADTSGGSGSPVTLPIVTGGSTTPTGSTSTAQASLIPMPSANGWLWLGLALLLLLLLNDDKHHDRQ